ncbi:uncharacterized protein BDR25DRAFT_319602 [Lindgomyces ingoldianus]|uniref:Uncharacterized protein n=1 Tax=Lindgomyces ingoldianus TaxID=673940 RepID=A0ACB6QAM6_9PLEO|nr:uncharacterized protein BDR25DRAFT_319602 [Lindgomyces ingoldianus]KAF2463946.1 hypothetical protein BDR25DRAFT_319602 [Lindgomyces ingoldianus]
MGSKPLAEIDEQFFDDHMNVNVKGQLFLVKAAAPLLTSVLPDALVYIATKGAIEQIFACPCRRLWRPGHYRQHHFSQAHRHRPFPLGEARKYHQLHCQPSSVQ